MLLTATSEAVMCLSFPFMQLTLSSHADHSTVSLSAMSSVSATDNEKRLCTC